MKEILITENNIIERALKAYFRSGGSLQPSDNLSGIQAINEKSCVVLRNVDSVLAVYRILNSGKLKRYKRIPKTLSP